MATPAAPPLEPYGVSINILSGETVNEEGQDMTPVLVKINPPSGQTQTPTDICCVLDISWSMSMEATVQAASGASESNGLSLLDIAKHAVRTIAHSLGSEDRLAIVEFSRQSKVVMPLTKMDDAGRKALDTAIQDVGFGNGTALWQGLSQGLETLRTGAEPGRFSHVMILTDGDTEDRANVMANLQRYKQSYGQLPGTVSTFGFGYEIESDLLVQIADYGSGTYAFIPDAGFVGTIFVNAMSNLLVTMAKDVRLAMTVNDSCTIQTKGGLVVESVSLDASTSYRLNVGTFQYGQSRDIFLQVQSNPGEAPQVHASVEFTTIEGPGFAEADGIEKVEPLAVDQQRSRCLFVDALIAAKGQVTDDREASLKIALACLSDAAQAVQDSPFAADDQNAALLEDIMGQSSEAFSKPEYYQKWGRHYAPSVLFAHKLQQCNNFKDPGVQGYGGELFTSVRDTADDAFNELSAPKVTPAMYRYLGQGRLIPNAAFNAGRAARPAAPNVRMAAYNDRYAGCIDGESMVDMAGGGSRRLCDVRAGDCVKGSDGIVAEVECVVRSRCPEGLATLVEVEHGIRLTPYHPVKIDGCWAFPLDVAPASTHRCEAVYSLLLRDCKPDFVVGSVPCVALGHGLKEGAAEHSYFGSQRVVQDLKKFPGYEAGLIDLRPCDVNRDAETGLVVGLIHSLQ